MSNITKDDIFKIHESLVDSFASNEQAKELMKKYNIEPKKIQFVYTNLEKDAKIILIEGIKYGNKGLKINKPLYIYESDGNYTKEVKKMFGECNNVAK